MNEPKTVGEDIITSSPEALYVQQVKDVDKMRSTLLLCNKNDPESAKRALNNITVLRIYHQIARIIRFTEMLDKIEDKMYESIDCTLQNMDAADPITWSTLMRIQSQLQKTMIESQQLLEPYLHSELFESIQIPDINAEQSTSNMLLDAESRQKLRDSATAVLAALESSKSEE